MYKTVRQGDASLQYTILPQVDQLYVNEMSSISGGAGGSPIKKVHQCPLEERFRITSARMVCLTLLIVAMFISCTIGAYLIHEMVSRRCAVQNLKASATSLTNGNLKTDNTLDNEDEIQPKDDSVTSIKTTATANSLSTSSLSNRISTSSSTIPEEEPSNLEFPMSGIASPSTPETHLTSSLFTWTEAAKARSSRSPPSVSSPSDSGSSVAEDESPDSRASILNAAPTNSIVNILTKLKILKTPRVTLKLTRITDTIPQMYLKTGIATYKKGKITTSVLAQGLTLEGLIFKTPDGTINPWREKWPFEQEETDTFHEKRTIARDLRALALMIVIVLLFVLLVMVLRLVKSAIDGWQNFEESQTENRDEAHSTLLAESQDPEDKE